MANSEEAATAASVRDLKERLRLRMIYHLDEGMRHSKRAVEYGVLIESLPDDLSEPILKVITEFLDMGVRR